MGILRTAQQQRDVVVLFGAAGGAGAAGGQGFADGRQLGGGGLSFGQGEVDAVEVGDAAAAFAVPQDLGGDVLAAGAQALVAELPDGEQAVGGPVVGVGGQAIFAAVGVVVVDPQAPGEATASARPTPSGTWAASTIGSTTTRPPLACRSGPWPSTRTSATASARPTPSWSRAASIS